jgi:hypothetical protein
MKYSAASIAIAAMLAFTPAASDADLDKGGAQKSTGAPRVDRDQTQDKTRLPVPDRVRDKDMDKDQLRDRDRIHIEDPTQLADQDIYGSELMTVEERNRYRRELKAAKTKRAKNELQVKHEKKMQGRAERQGKDLVPPGQGKIYGSELMTLQERNEYRERQRHYSAGEGLEEFQTQHREEMRKRALAIGLIIEEAQ